MTTKDKIVPETKVPKPLISLFLASSPSPFPSVFHATQHCNCLSVIMMNLHPASANHHILQILPEIGFGCSLSKVCQENDEDTSLLGFLKLMMSMVVNLTCLIMFPFSSSGVTMMIMIRRFEVLVRMLPLPVVISFCKFLVQVLLMGLQWMEVIKL